MRLSRNVLVSLGLVLALGLLGQLLTRHSPLRAQANAQTTETGEGGSVQSQVVVPGGSGQVLTTVLPARPPENIGMLPPEWLNFELRFYLKAEMVPLALPRDITGVFYIDGRVARQDANGFVLREIVFPEQFSENLLWLPAHNVLFVTRL